MLHNLRILAVVAVGAVASASGAQAATLSFSLTDDRGSDPSATDVVLTDIAGGVNMSFKVNDPTNTADLAAVYFNIGGSDGINGDDVSISIAGPVTSVATGTSNVQAGNIGEVFDVGVAIGATGSGFDFYDEFSFDVLATNLDISDFFGQTFAVRGQTVGSPPNGGNGSSKNFGVAGRAPDTNISPVPLPASSLMLIAGIGGLVAMRRRKKKS